MTVETEWGLGYEKEGKLFLLPRDVEWRRSLYPADVMEHPGKMQLHIVKASVEYYERSGYLHDGSVILDPFGGTGTTAIASLVGPYKVILMELEEVYLDLLKRVRKAWSENTEVKYPLTLMAGDCRQLMPLMEQNSVDLVISSPPYANLKVGDVKTEFTGQLAEMKAQMHRYGSSSAHPLNFGRLNTFVFNQQMQLVYRQIASVLKPGGFYVSVTKDAMRAGVRNRLAIDVIRTCQANGLKYTGHWWKWKPPGGMLQSVMKSKGSEVVEDEDIIEFQKADSA